LVVGGSIHICWFSINKMGWGSYLINQHFSRMGWTSCRNKRVSFPGPVSPRSSQEVSGHFTGMIGRVEGVKHIATDRYIYIYK
jgi:hypothetical protein